MVRILAGCVKEALFPSPPGAMPIRPGKKKHDPPSRNLGPKRSRGRTTMANFSRRMLDSDKKVVHIFRLFVILPIVVYQEHRKILAATHHMVCEQDGLKSQRNA